MHLFSTPTSGPSTTAVLQQGGCWCSARPTTTKPRSRLLPSSTPTFQSIRRRPGPVPSPSKKKKRKKQTAACARKGSTPGPESGRTRRGRTSSEEETRRRTDGGRRKARTASGDYGGTRGRQTMPSSLREDRRDAGTDGCWVGGRWEKSTVEAGQKKSLVLLLSRSNFWQ